MKGVFLKFAAVFAMIAGMVACGGQANAAPVAVTNSTGTVVYGTQQAMSAEKDTSAGFNRVKVLYSSGYQYITDDAAWSRFAKVVSGFAVAVSSSPTLVYDAAKSNGIYCQNSNSVIAWPNAAQPDTVSDGCAAFNAAKAAGQ